MNKNTFTSCLSTSDFKSLFIREMGWNNPQGQTSFDIIIEGETYSFNQIAEKSGFQVILCKIDEIPTSSMCKKIDTRLRRQANDYICIYHMSGSQHHLWVAPVKKVEKRDLVLVEYESAEKAGFLYEKIDDLSFDLDEVTTIMDVKERIQHTFVVNSDKITKDFYAGFRKEHTNFAKFISGIDDQITDIKKNRNKQWYTSVMLNRLMFCYFIQKKGFLDQNTDYLSDKLRWVKQIKGKNKFYGFYRGFLLSLFHDGLNEPLHENEFIEKYGRIPYLNGGMFSIHELEEQYKNIDIKDEAFESLFAFFDQWHWHLDDRLTASGRDINPDVLGYIFEQYINDRAQMGAYYTKEDITEYIGRNTIVPYLMDATKKMDEKPFKTNGAVWNFLKESGDTYIYDAVKKGSGLEIPEEIAIGIDTTKPNLLERRSRWNEKTPEEIALPTEIWRETIERLQRYNNIKTKIENGEIHEINDFITYNLDIRQFVQDLLAQTDDHLFVLHFYHALQKVTILDPTCGSGAFLFAALNILEPLYETCISRMQDWQAQNPNLFKDELEELNVKYRSNIRYFIYKSIILRNLYGVDIMVEATEIAKLRLFLKMVAVVDVNPRDPNLGLEPLPDVDFNIRCGNTLVGYATKAELDNDLKFGDMFEKMEFEQKVKDKIKVVSKAFAVFKEVQLTQTPNLETYKVAKKQLKETLRELNELLNQKMYSQVTALSYDKWLSSHQPFHWFAEYYDIIEGNGGFDVIIGNPPYVKINSNASNLIYEPSNAMASANCGDLFGYCLERITFLTQKKYGLIIPLSLTSTGKMLSLKNFVVQKSNNIWTSYYSASAQPCTLFEGVRHRLMIIITEQGNEKCITFSTNFIKWLTSERINLFSAKIHYANTKELGCCKIGNDSETNILCQIRKEKELAYYIKSFGEPIYYHNAPVYWGKVFNFIPMFQFGDEPPVQSSHLKTLFFEKDEYASTVICILNSSLFYWFNWQYSNCRDLAVHNIEIFRFSLDIETKEYFSTISKLCSSLMRDYKKNSIVYKRISNGILTQFDSFYPAKSKPIIDEIDKVLAKHYGFTEEELDFIINYDIKYRMGDELDDDSEKDEGPKQEVKASLSAPKERKTKNVNLSEPEDKALTMYVRHETLERISSGEKTTFKRYLNDEDFAKEVLVTENGKYKPSDDNCPYTAKNITSIKLVCDKETLVKAITKITFRKAKDEQGNNAWKIVFHF